MSRQIAHPNVCRVYDIAEVDNQQILSFYMGKSTPEQKDYIMENRVVPVEECRAQREIPKSKEAPSFNECAVMGRRALQFPLISV